MTDCPPLAEKSVRKILICQQRQLGDVILATPVISLLAKRFPWAAIHFFTEKKCVDLLRHHPALTRIWPLEKGMKKELALYWSVAREGFDLVVDFQQLPRCRWVTLFSRAGIRLSYPPPWYKRPLYNCSAPVAPGYAVESKVSMLRPLGIEWNGELPRIHLLPDELEQAMRILEQSGLGPQVPFVTVDPTHRRETRRWPLAHFSRLISLAASRWKELKFFVLYGPGEQEEAASVVRAAGTDQCILAPRILSLREMAGVIKYARLHLGTCSAPRHIAVAVDTPSLIIMGSTSPRSWTYPSKDHQTAVLDIPCRPCNKDTCPDIRCMHDLMPEQVLSGMERMLAGNRSVQGD